MRKIRFICLHHTVSPRDTTTVSDIKKWHEARGLGEGCQYHYTILGSGKLRHTRQERRVGNHCKGKNEGSLGIALTGSFDKERPSQAQLEALENLLEKLCKKYGLNAWDIYGHCELASGTLCPGEFLMKEFGLIKVRLSQTLRHKVEFPKIPMTVEKYATWNDRLVGWLISILDKMRG